MVANSWNLIVTVKPANQRAMAAPRRGSYSRTSQLSSDSHQSTHSQATSQNSDEDHFDQDEVVDLTGVTLDESAAILPTAKSVTTIAVGGVKDDGVLHLWG